MFNVCYAQKQPFKNTRTAGGAFTPFPVAGLRALQVAFLEHYGWLVWSIIRNRYVLFGFDRFDLIRNFALHEWLLVLFALILYKYTV